MGSIEVYADDRKRRVWLSHIWREKTQEGESIEPAEVEDNKNTSVKEKQTLCLEQENDVMLTDGRESLNYLIAALLFFLIKELALKVGGRKHN